MKKLIMLLIVITGITFLCIYCARAGTLEFDGVPVDITTTANEDLVICPGEGGNVQIGDGTGTNSYAGSNDDLYITGTLEVDGAAYLESGLIVSDALTALNGIISGSSIVSDTDSTDDLGSPSIAWLNLYVGNIKTVSGTNLTFLPTMAYTIIGDAGTAGHISLNDDLFVSGALEVDDSIYADGGVITAAITSSTTNLSLNPASGYGLTSTLTRSAATGNEAAYDLSAVINKATSGNYTALKLNVTETSAPGTADKLLDLQRDSTSYFQVYNGINSANYGLISVGSSAWDGATAGFFSGSANGTLLAGNAASGFTGNLLNLQVAGSSKFNVDADGNVTAAGIITGTGADISGTSANTFTIDSDGDADPGILTFGGASGKVATTAGDLTLDPAGNDVILDNANLNIQSGYGISQLGGSTGVSLSGASGVLTLAGIGNTHNENVTLSFESGANYAVWNSTSGLNRMWSYLSFNFEDGFGNKYGGSGSDSSLKWVTEGNDNLQLGIACGSADQSGYFSLMKYADMGNANRSSSGTSADPVFRIYSSDATQALDYGEFYHDQNNFNIVVGNGNLDFSSQYGTFDFNYAGTEAFRLFADIENDQVIFATLDETGNQIIIANRTVFNKNYDHVVQTNPTLYIHSDLSPDTSNNQWGSLAWITDDFIISTGANTGAGSAPTTDDNAIVFKPRGVEAGRFDSAGLDIVGDLIIDGGDIGLTADTDLIQIAADSVTLNGIVGIGTSPSTSYSLVVDGDFSGKNTSGCYIDYDNTYTGVGSGNMRGFYVMADATSAAVKETGTLMGIDVWARDDATVACTGWGVRGINAYADSDHSSVPCYGVYSWAGGLGTNYGVYGKASGGSTNYPAYFTGGPVMITDGTHTVNNATSDGDLFVDGSLEVDGAIYGTVSGGSALTGTTADTFTINSDNTTDVVTTLTLGGAGTGTGTIATTVGDLTLDPAGNDVILDNANLQIQSGYGISQLGGSTGVSLSGASGVFTMAGIGGTNNENLTLDFETTENNVIIGSGTGVFLADFNDISLKLRDSYTLGFGNGRDVRVGWEPTGNDNLQIGTLVGSTDYSGYISIMEQADMANANRSPLSTSANPVFRIYSSDATQALDYGEFYHNQTDFVTDIGQGDYKIYPSAGGDVVLFSTGDMGDVIGKKLKIGRIDSVDGDVYLDLYISGSGTANIDSPANQCNFAKDASSLHLMLSAQGPVYYFSNCASGENRSINQYGWITAAATRKWIRWQVNDVTDYFELTREDTNILGFDIQMPTIISGDVSAASWLTAGIQYQGAAATFTDTGDAGTRATGAVSSFAQPTLAGTNAVTITDAATLYIADAPAAGTNMTITNPYALWVDAGNVLLDGDLTVGGTLTATVSGESALTGTTADTFTINSDNSANAATLALGSAADTASGAITTGVGDLTITPAGDDLLLDGGLTVGSTTEAGDNNLRVEGIVGIGVAPTSIRKVNILQTIADSAGYGMYLDLNHTDDGSLTATVYGSFVDVDSTSTNAKSNGSLYGSSISVNDDATSACSAYTLYGQNITVDSDHSSVPCYGVYSWAAGLGTNYGVYGKASGGSTNYPAYFTGGPVMITDGTHTVNNATSDGDLFVDGSLEVDGTIYGTLSGGSAITGTTADTFTINSDNSANAATLALGSAADTASGAITTGVGDLTITPAGDDLLLDGGLTVGSATEAGDDNLRVEGVAAIGGAPDTTSSLMITRSSDVMDDRALEIDFDCTKNTTFTGSTWEANYIDVDLTDAFVVQGYLEALSISISATAAGATDQGSITGLRVSAYDDSTTTCDIWNVYGGRFNADSDHSSVPCFGVYGSAAGLGTNYGVYGKASSGSTNYPAYFTGGPVMITDGTHTVNNATSDGDLFVDGSLEVDGTIYGTGLTPGGNITMGDGDWIGIGSAAERIVFDGTGGNIEVMGCSVGIGTATANSTLSVGGSGASGASIYGGGSSVGVYGDGSVYGVFGTSTAGYAIGATQQGTLTANNISPAVRAHRSLALGAFDATAAVLQVEDDTASTGHLQEWKKQGVVKAVMDKDGNLGIGTTPDSYLDIMGSATAGTKTLRLRGGDLGAPDAYQILFSYNGGASFAHNIRTRHNGSAGVSNAIDFYVWNYGVDAAGDAGTKHVMSLNDGNVGIGVTGPAGKLHVAGDVSAASWLTAGIQYQGAAATFTDTDVAGTRATGVVSSFAQPTLAGTNAVTITDAATLYIANAPAAGTNMTITNPYALWVDAGNVLLDGDLTVGGTLTATVSGGSALTGTTADTFTINSDNSANAATLALGSAADTASGAITTGVGDLTITPAGDDLLLDGGLTVGSTTEAGDNNLRIEGTTTLVGKLTSTASLDAIEIDADSAALTLDKSATANNAHIAYEDNNVTKWRIGCIGDNNYTAYWDWAARSTLTSTGDLTLVGDLAVNGDDITCDADLTLDPAGNDVILDNANLNIQSTYGIQNTGAALKINPTAAQDVTFFEDTNVENDVDGKSLYVHRKAAVGDDSLRMYVDSGGDINFDGTTGADFVFDCASDIGLDAGGQDIIFMNVGSGILGFQGDRVDDEMRMSLYVATGNMLVVTTNANVSMDHDHAVQTDPTLFINSALSPNTSNNQWGSFTHNQENLVITTGANVGTGTVPTTDDNAIIFAPRGVDQVIIDGDGNVGIGTTGPNYELQVDGAISMLEKSADPTEPAEGECVIWMSDGTGKGDDGDVLIAGKAGGVTKWSTLFDHSAGGAW